MSSRERRWEELQARWAQGERLSDDEERERLAFASHDPLARRELDIFATLRERAAAEAEPVAPSLIERALDAVSLRPRLRLVTSTVSDTAAPAVTRQTARSRTALVAASLMLAAAAGLALAIRSAPPHPVTQPSEPQRAVAAEPARSELVLAAGEVRVGSSTASVGQRALVQGQHVSTGNGRACITIEPAIDVCLDAHSGIVLESLATHDVRIRVEAGTALAALSRRGPESSFSLVAADVSATARGTIFAARRGSGETEVVVLEGAVEVARGPHQRERLGTHSRVLVHSTAGSLEPTPIDPRDEARLIALRAPHRLWTGTAVGVLEVVSATPAGLRASIDDEAPLPLPLRAFVRAGKRRVSFRDATGGESTSWIEVPAGDTRRIEAPVKAAVPPVASERADKPSAAALLEAARREVARANLREGLALYERLRATHPTSAEGRTVLVTMGKLELDLGRPERALRRFEAYLRDGGALAPEALAGKIRALRALGRRGEERDAIQQYLARHPNGFGAPLFEKRLHEISRP